LYKTLVCLLSLVLFTALVYSLEGFKFVISKLHTSDRQCSHFLDVYDINMPFLYFVTFHFD